MLASMMASVHGAQIGHDIAVAYALKLHISLSVAKFVTHMMMLHCVRSDMQGLKRTFERFTAHNGMPMEG